MMAVGCSADRHEGQVLSGLDVLERDGFAALAGRRVGLITNHTGINRKGVSNVELLRDAPSVQLVALFSPEHGFHGTLDQETVDDAHDERSGLRIHSLYGQTRKPTPAMLEGIDTLVFDIQDVGTRFYTYIATMALAMEAAAEHGLRFVVLDRPNPINGLGVAGPVLDPGREAFVACHPIPVRHGMTVGELARMLNAERTLGLDLRVVPVEGWRRGDSFDATGLPWVNPSPNMRSVDEAFLYPGVGLLEATNLSVGRGTATPFEVVGAPWLDGERLAEALGRDGLPCVSFRPTAFTPSASKFAGERCGGVVLEVTDRRAFRAVRMGLAIARQLRLLQPDDWDPAGCDHLLRHAKTLEALTQARPLDEIEAQGHAGLQAFLERRARFLLYAE